ncbi:Ig domain-containing protein [Burkholderia cepacia]|uniref:Ig domain-containing protein n=1 Tax=Burkholderia cepacia TaxID=292 RepID=UPI0009BE3D2E|nr:Ig domain-containing protein [Burkholderia cepacia]
MRSLPLSNCAGFTAGRLTRQLRRRASRSDSLRLAAIGAARGARHFRQESRKMTSTLHIPAGYLTLGLDSTGAVVELIDSRSGRNYISPGKSVPLVRLVINGVLAKPAGVRWSSADNTLSFVNDAGLAFEVDVRVLQKNGYATFEVTRVSTDPASDVKTLLWGPLPVAINQTVGEAAGVVRDNEFAIGLKPLNDRTEGAWPKEYPQYGWENEVIANPYNLYVASMEPWSVAAKTSWGAVLRAFTFDYTRRRERLNANDYPIPLGPLDGAASVIGSKIALYGSAPELVTTILSFIASGENLPYPTQNGQWQKVAQASGQSSFVLDDLDTGNVGKAARFANSAGINYLYSPKYDLGPWQSTGHYQFDSSFGGSDNGAEKLVDTAKECGVRVGVHTMSDFISVSPPDPYVSPPADPRLALGGQAPLSRNLSATSNMLFLGGYVPVQDGINKQMLRIGNEFISFNAVQRGVTEWKVSGLTRGQWGSVPAEAARGTPVARVIVNSYDGAIGGLGIIDEIATRLGTIRNKVGIRYHSFDGVESASQTGWGSFGIARLINGTYAAHTGHDGYISETSRMTSNAWDTLTRANWSNLDMDQLYRNNAFYQANYLPGMLGWFDITGVSLTMIETRLARGAALNAGIGFQSTMAFLLSADETPDILDKIKQWETARNLGAFTEKQRAALRDQTTSWTLKSVTPGQSWSLQQVNAEGVPIGAPQTVSAPTPQLGPAVLPVATQGALYGAKITTNTPATVRFTVTNGGLPPGLQFNQDTGGIIGTPRKTGRYTFTVTATNDGGLADARAVYTILVQ